MSYDFRAVTCTDEELTRLCALLNATFTDDEPFTPEFLRWQYLDNPEGRVLGFNAFLADTDRLVAHYVAIPIRARLFGSEAPGLLSLNTVTDEAHQGRGLLTELGTRTYEEAKRAGKQFAVGVANARSVHGMTHKLRFQNVGLLETRFVAGASRDRSVAPPPSYERVWDARTVAWRLANPRRSDGTSSASSTRDTRRYFVAPTGNGTDSFIFGRSKRYPALVGCVPSASVPADIGPPPASLVPFRLWLGRDPRVRFKASVRVPEAARAVPLHFIFRDLTADSGSPQRRLAIDDACFWALDFDAY